MPRCTSLSQPYDRSRSRLLIAFVSLGLVCMLIPGALLGLSNLLLISLRRAPGNVLWSQAHAHAQIFGWLGSFIFGVGFYAIPRLRNAPLVRPVAWAAWWFWSSGVVLRILAILTFAEWRLLLPLSALLELTAASLFCIVCFMPTGETTNATSRMSLTLIATSATGMVATLIVNLVSALIIVAKSQVPVATSDLNSLLLFVAFWGWIVPMIWGFGARWLPATLGLKPTRVRLMNIAMWLTVVAVLTNFIDARIASGLVLAGATCIVVALRMFERAEREAKTRGVHITMPLFVRLSYGWLLVAALLQLIAFVRPEIGGLPNAARHALGVGFIAGSVFTIAPRYLPAFFGAPKLFSPRLMFISLLFLNLGCAIRVIAQISAYSNLFDHAWLCLRAGAVCDAVAFLTFVVNMIATVARTRARSENAPATTLQIATE